MKYMYLVCGHSGSGKSTIVKEIENKCLKFQLPSYTERPKRHPDEIGHIFVTKEEFDSILPDICAYTKINGYRYGTTNALIDKYDVYIIDPAGIKYLKEHYTGNKKLVTIKINVSKETFIQRMIERGDSEESIAKRLITLENEFDSFTDYDECINNDGDIDNAVNEFAEIIYKYEGRPTEETTDGN